MVNKSYSDEENQKGIFKDDQLWMLSLLKMNSFIQGILPEVGQIGGIESV